MKTETHDVVIVGAGLAGLSTAVFLALNGVRAVVIERNASTSILPKARGQNPVSMEMLRMAGITDAIRAARPPGKPAITSLVSESLTGRVIYDHIAHRPDFSRFSPEIPGMASQARAEEALLQRARELGVDVRFQWTCERIEETDERVALELRDLQADAAFQVSAKYVVACDGIRGAIAGQVGIGHHGVGHLKSVTAVRFNADLSRWAGGNSMTIHYVKNPALPDGSGILVSTDYENQWVGNFSADPDRTPEETRRLIRILLGLDDIDFEVTGETTYNYSHRIADRLSSRRVFLAGDAAHVMPPTGGQGGNTAMQDGFYLGWKLAYVLRGIAGPALLESYDVERRPYAEIVCTWQAANLAERRDMKNLGTLLGEPIDHARMMFGYMCVDGAFVRSPGQTTVSAADPFEDPSQPTGMPGARVPYALLQAGSDVINTRHQLAPRFQLYTADARMASQAQAIAQDKAVPQQVTVVDSVAPIQLDAGESMLVRPDGVVAWRGRSADALAQAYDRVLARA
jgi:2-polyprenyl-6-methoxyphenol hydroxylase-like FAD-dependent oxidoreductase